MCSVIKVQNNTKRVQLRVNSGIEEIYSDHNTEEDLLAEKLKVEFDKGYQTAVDELEAKFKQETGDAILSEKEKLAALINNIDTELQQYEAQFSEMVVTVALAMAKKILHQEIDKHSPLIENITQISQKMLGANYLVIKANPEEIQKIKDDSNNLFAEGNFSKVKFEVDQRIEKGGFVIESDIGNIDGQVSSQLNEIKKAIGNLSKTTE